MTGNKAGAGASIIEALELARRTGTWYLLQDIALFVLVLTLLVFDRTEEAVELHGAHRALSAMRARLPEAVVSSYEDAIAGARKALGERAFQRLAAVGGLSTQPAVLDRAERRALALIDPASETTPTIPDNGQADESFPGATHNLSRRELEVLRLLASGCSNKDMAALLELRPKTVTHYASNLYRKLEVSGRAQAVSAAWRFGLLEFQE
jgi:DNA-binding NarL/FixJ family response regulator